MKKLMIMLAIGVVASIAQAATCNWGSGALKTAASATGGWSDTYAAAANATITMSIYLIDSDTYTSLAGSSQKDLFDAYSTQAASLTGQNKNPTTSALINAITITDSAAPASVQYAVVTATYKDATYGDMYMATLAQASFNSATSKGNAAAILSGVGDWQAVPEPTSGLLMLLGMAGLALRRRRA